MKGFNFISIAIFALIFLVGCVKADNSPGYEYTPDMYRSPAIETYVDYDFVKDKYNANGQAYKISALIPPANTIKFTGSNELYAFINAPLDYTDSDADRDRASAQLKNPLPYSPVNVEQGKHLYTNFCNHCHGEKGKGDGKVAQNSDLINPPADAFSKTEGSMFHTITYGKGAMGSHASQLEPIERWKLIEYLQVLNNGGSDFPTDSLATLAVDSSHTSLVMNDIYFKTGSSNLDYRKSINSLNAIVNYMSINADKRIELSGHTDTTGSDNFNMTLSQKRADAVKNYLLLSGISDGRIESVGYGETKPVEGGLGTSRRTEVKILN